MKCPVCSAEMIEENFGIKVNVCKNGCKGMWFDWGELAFLDEHDEGLGEALKEALNYPRANEKKRGKIKCPKCGISMQTHKYKRSKEVNVDECYNCGGFFLDSGELTEIRDTYMNDQEVNAYADKLFNEVPGIKDEKADIEKSKKRKEAIQRYTKFFQTNYWKPK